MSQKRPVAEVDHESEAPVQAKRLKLINSNDVTLARKVEKVIRREFAVEIRRKEEEIELIGDRLNQAKRLLDRLRACIIASYYGRVMCGSSQTARTDVPQPTPIHPTVKRLVGKTVRHGPANQSDTTSDTKSSISSSDTDISLKSVSSGYASGVGSRFDSLLRSQEIFYKQRTAASSASSSVSSVAANDNATTKRWNPSKITKRIVVGNVSKYLAAGKKDANDVMRYKWMVYVQGASKEERDISHFVDKVIFMLDESYRPNDVITVTQPPFTLKRHGWGEFPVRVQLHFKGSATKCVDIIHELKLDKTHTGWTTLGAETTYDINVDSSLFMDSRPASFPPPNSSPRRRNPRLSPRTSPRAASSAASVASELELEAVVKAEPPDGLDDDISANLCKTTTLSNLEATTTTSSELACNVPIKSEPCSPQRCSQTPGIDQHAVVIVGESGVVSVSPVPVSPVLVSPVPVSPVRPRVQRSPRSSNNDKLVRSSPARRTSQPSECQGSMMIQSPAVDRSVSSMQTSSSSNEPSGSTAVPHQETIADHTYNVQVKLEPQSPEPSFDSTITCTEGLMEQSEFPSSVNVSSVSAVPTAPAAESPCVTITNSEVNATSSSSSAGNPISVSTPISSGSTTSSGVSVSLNAGVSTPVSKREEFISCRDTAGRMLLIPKSLLATMRVASSGSVMTTNAPARPTVVRTVTNTLSVSSSQTPLTLSVVAKNAAVSRSASNSTNEPIGSSTTVLKPPLLLSNGLCASVRSNGSSPRANINGVRATAGSNVSVMLKPNQLARGPLLTSPQGQRLFLPTGARPIERGAQPNIAGNGIVIRPASSSCSSSDSTRLPARASSIFVMPEIRKSLSTRPLIHSSSAPTLCLAVPRPPAVTRPAASKSDSVAPVYFVLEKNNAKTLGNTQQGPVQFVVMPEVNKATRPEATNRLPIAEMRALPRAPRPTSAPDVAPVVYSAGTSAAKPAVIRPPSSIVCFSASNSVAVEPTAASGARAKSGGQISLLRAPHTSFVESTSTTVRSSNPATLTNTVVLPGGKTFATKIGGQTVIVDMAGSATSAVGAAHTLSTAGGLRNSVGGSRSLLNNGFIAHSSASGSSYLSSVVKDRLPLAKSARDVSLAEKNTPADSSIDVVSLNECKSVEDLVRLFIKHYPLFAADIDRSLHPYCAPSWEAFLNWNVGKRRAAELFRAKALQERIFRALDGARCFRGEEVWSRRRIIQWCRRHLYTPFDNETCRQLKESAAELNIGSSVTPLDPLLDSLESATNGELPSVDSDNEIDVIEIDDEPEPCVKKENISPVKSYGLKEFLPMSLEAQFVHETMDLFGIRPNPVAVDGFPCVFASSVEEMIAKSMKLIVDDVLRSSAAMMYDSGRKPAEIGAADVYRCLVADEKFDFLTNRHMGVTLTEDDPPNSPDGDA